MFDAQDGPRVFGMPPGADFPAELVAGLRAMHAGHPPEALARVRLIVNTRRMARRVRDLFDAGPPCLPPRIELVTDLGLSTEIAEMPEVRPALRRRLELARIIAALIEANPDIAPRAAIYDLADSLGRLMDEMQSEGVPPETLNGLDVSDESGHWQRALDFVRIAQDYDARLDNPPDAWARLRDMVKRTVAAWAETPPPHPIILAGSTGSRGPTHILMQAVARLPQGAVVLPGFDFDMPAKVWAGLDDALTGADHPQYRFVRLLAGLGMEPSAVQCWNGATAPVSGRNRVVSLALRPAPVTDQWREEGPALTGLGTAMERVTLLEAPSARAEALAIAMRLRQSVEEGRTAALISPDRMLTRQVAAALDRWDIVPDDSAGQPLALSPPGRFLRHVAELQAGPLTAEALLSLLKHPLTHGATDRGPHLLLSRNLELRLRRHGPPHPDATAIRAFAATQSDPIAAEWAEWVCTCFLDRETRDPCPLEDRVRDHLALAEAISAGHRPGAEPTLWQGDAGREATLAINELIAEAPAGGPIGAADYVSLFNSVISGEVRDPDSGHPHTLIWGTGDARIQGADLVILGGLNEGAWPGSLVPDPWLNRRMRHEAGLLVPERQVGLEAHDFQQAICAPEVWLTRSVRNQDAESVPSRWVSRLTNLLDGLPGEGQAALAAMRDRGRHWLAMGRALERADPVASAPRPAPCPPPEARPKQLSVTEIKRLIRDPYAIYARHVLRIRPLDPLMAVPDALLRGTVIHEVLEGFIRRAATDPRVLNRDALLAECETKLAELVPWAEARLLWQARLARVADSFLADEARRLDIARPAGFEVKGRASFTDPPFTLTAKADRVDLDEGGNARIYDYKTGKPPSKNEQLYFDRQLLLSAAIAELSGFGQITPRHVAAAIYIGLGSGGGEVPAPLDDEVTPASVWAEFQALIRAYSARDQGYTSRRAMFSKADRGDYDQLARFGEWDVTTPPTRVILE